MLIRIVLVAVLALAVVGCSSQEASDTTSASARAPASVEPAAADEPTGCKDNGDCEEKYYCAKPVGECESDAGECVVKPEICPHNWDPVCACNGKTYGNACSAAAAGQNIAYKGECGKPRGA